MAIVLRTISDSTQAQSDLAKLRESVNNIQTSVEKTSTSFINLAKVVSAGFAGYAAFQAFTRYSDQLTNIEGQLRLVTKSQEEFTYALSEVRNIANTTRSDLQITATLYSKLARSSKDFGASQSDVAKITDLVSKSIAASYSGAQEANAAILQLGQALASGKLAGDELKSILENAPPLAEAIAKGLGVSIGKLRKLGEEGKITSVSVFKAILKQQAEIEDNFKKIPITFGGAFRNLGNSLVTLFDEVKKASLGSTGRFAESINNLANSIFGFATNLSLTLSIAKLKLVLFVTDVVLLFNDIWSVLEKTGENIRKTSLNLYEDWRPVLISLSNDILEWAQFVAKNAQTAAISLYAAFNATTIGNTLIANAKYAINLIKEYATSAFNAIISTTRKIDVQAIFPGLSRALEYLKEWAIAAERWFFWLYDKVVGNSWIPDLVQQVTEWLGKLTKKPLSLIADFVSKANLQFAGIRITAPFIAGLTALYKFKSELLVILGILGSIAAVAIGFKISKTNTIDTSQKIGEKRQGKLEEILEKSSNWLKKIKTQIEDSFNKSVFGRNIKQLLGIQDKTPGQIFGVTIDTNSKVGRGPLRNYEDRPIGHDFINMLPPGWQLPTVAAFTGVFVLAIMRAFESGPVRSVLISIVTTLGGVFAAKVIDDKTISSTFSKTAFTFISIIEEGITALFSGNVLKDPLGVLSTIAKTALLFEAGRKAISEAAIGIATAPTKAAQSVTSVLERSLLRKDIAATNKEIAKLPTNLKTAVITNKQIFDQVVNQLSRLRDSNGSLIGQQRALAAINSKNISAFGTLQSRLSVAQGIKEAENLRSSQANLASVRQIRERLTSSRAASSEREQQITKNLQAQSESLRAGLQSFGAGAGGILGGLAGLQIGTEIARGMTSSPAWVQVGTAIGISFAGQAIGAGIGSLIAQGITAGASKIGTLIGDSFNKASSKLGPIISNPFILAAAAVAGIIAIALNWEKLKEIFDDFQLFWSKKIVPLLDIFIKRLENLWKEIKEVLNTKLEPNKPAVSLPIVGDVSRKEVFDITATTGTLALIAAKFGVFDKIIGNLNTTISSNVVGLSMQFDLLKQGIVTYFSNIKAALGPLGTLGTIVIGAITAVLSVGAVKAAIVAGVAYLIYKLISELTSLFVSEAKVQTPSLKQPAGRAEIPYEPLKRATGGWINGPGTSTSDSIPALLSNGEFVVNAKDARKNWQILTAINSGIAVNRFKNGTQIDTNATASGPTPAKTYSKEEIQQAKLQVKSIISSFPQISFEETDNLPFLAHGTYEPFTGQLKIIKTASEQLKYGTALHELGHADYFINKLKIVPNSLFSKTRSTFLNVINLLSDRQGQLNDKILLDFESYAIEYSAKNQKYFLNDPDINSQRSEYQRSFILKNWNLISENFNKYKNALDISDDGEINNSVSDIYLKNLEKYSTVPAVKSKLENLIDSLQNLSFRNVLKRATGGWISGAGSATSDSIPAMLSNGEFVVNAKDAKKNWDILTAINSGIDVRKFQSGTEKTSKPLITEVKATEVAGQIFDRLKNLLGFSKPQEQVKEKAATNTIEVSGIQALLESSQKLDLAFIETKKSLENAGFEKVDLKAIKEFSKTDPGQFRRFASAIDAANKALKNAENKSLSEFLRNENRQRANEVFKGIIDAVNQAKIAEVPSKFKDIPEEKKPTKLTFENELKLIQEVFPELGISLEDLSNMSNKVRERLLRDAAKIAKEIDKINSLEIGTVQGGIVEKLPGGDVEARRREIENERKFSLIQARDSIKAFRVPFKDLKIDFDKLGLTLSEDAYNSLDEATINLIKELKSEALLSLENIRKVDITSDIRRQSQLNFLEIAKEINKILQEAPIKAIKGFEGFKARINSLGVSLDENVYNSLNEFERNQLEALAMQVESFRKNIRELERKSDTKDPTGEVRNSIQVLIDNILSDASKIIASKGKDNKLRTVGETFANNLNESVSTGISSFLKGKSSKNELLKSILDSFTNSVIDNFVKGLTEPLIGKKGKFEELFIKLGSGIYEMGSKLIEKAFSTKTSGPVEATSLISSGIKKEPLTSIPSVNGTQADDSLFGKLKEVFSGFITPILNFLGPIGTAIAGLFSLSTGTPVFEGSVITFLTGIETTLAGILIAVSSKAAKDTANMFSDISAFAFASGGYVSGPGTATSDSIPAMLSNGEFVVNAKAAKQNMNLLTSINNGSFRKLAEGGLVESSITNTPTIIEPKVSKNNGSMTQQVFNINVTGDISRQTKSEILGMLPQIAAGVNKQNREKRV